MTTSTKARPTPVLMSISACGPYLDQCRCRHHGPVAQGPNEMRARHEASVARAIRSGWATDAQRGKAALLAHIKENRRG